MNMKNSAVYRKLLRRIEKEKAKLIAAAKRDGICENFGAKEFQAIRDDFFRLVADEEYDMKQREFAALRNFDDWCANYCG